MTQKNTSKSAFKGQGQSNFILVKNLRCEKSVKTMK